MKDQPKIRGVYERDKGSGVWWIHYYDGGGRRHREKVGPKPLAIAAYQKRKTDIRERKFFPEAIRKRPVTFAEVIADALEYSRAHKRPDSYRADKWHSEAVLEWFPSRSAAEIKPQEIEKRLVEMADKGRAAATLNRYRAFLSLAYSVAIRNEKLTVNPARLVRLRRENNARVRYVTVEEEKRLRAAIRNMHPAWEPELDLALNTGMRKSEQFHLRWTDVGLEAGILTIPRSKHGEKRHIPLNAAARAAIATLRRQTLRQALYVIPGPQKGRTVDSRRWFEDVVVAAKVADLHWHDLRHTFASRLAMAGRDLLEIKELLGHKTLAMTIRYAHLMPSRLKEAIDSLCATATETATQENRKVPELRQVVKNVGAGGGT